MLKLIKLRNELFWDIDPEKLDEQKNKRIIIERVVNFGNLADFKSIINFYGKEAIMNTIRNLNYIDPKTLNFLSILFKIPKSGFKCYTKKQSIKQHWTY